MCDTYIQNRIKGWERRLRGDGRLYVLKNTQIKLPSDMSSFLRDGQNKELLFNLTEQSVIESSLNHSIIESKLSVFGKNDSCRLSNCLQSHIF